MGVIHSAAYRGVHHRQVLRRGKAVDKPRRLLTFSPPSLPNSPSSSHWRNTTAPKTASGKGAYTQRPCRARSSPRSAVPAHCQAAGPRNRDNPMDDILVNGADSQDTSSHAHRHGAGHGRDDSHRLEDASRRIRKPGLQAFSIPAKDTLGTGYHVMQSKIAIGSGGLTGKGFTAGTQGKLHVPAGTPYGLHILGIRRRSGAS